MIAQLFFPNKPGRDPFSKGLRPSSSESNLTPGHHIAPPDKCTRWLYEGAFQFSEHYFGPKPGELREKSPNGSLTEKFRCARYLEDLDEIAFWMRSLPRKPSSFWLQTATDWLYSDFVCRLKDGRTLVVEYKGGHLWTDAEDKRTVGAVWESRSGGCCLFVMPTEVGFSTIAQKISPRSRPMR